VMLDGFITNSGCPERETIMSNAYVDELAQSTVFPHPPPASLDALEKKHRQCLHSPILVRLMRRHFVMVVHQTLGPNPVLLEFRGLPEAIIFWFLCSYDRFHTKDRQAVVSDDLLELRTELLGDPNVAPFLFRSRCAFYTSFLVAVC
jgi:hypothetical protein